MSAPSVAVTELTGWLGRFAPLRLAESWDNVGLLWGDPQAPVERVMTCLGVHPASAAEAVREGVGLIVTHHPVLFRAVKSLRADTVEGSMLLSLARAGVAVYSPHTALDNCEGGINDGLARRLGLVEVLPLRASPPSPQFKIVVFTPESDREAVLAAAFQAGAGRIGAYDECSFGLEGSGTFYGTEGANPTIGQAGRREVVSEWRLEILCPSDRLAAALGAIRQAHSYEEPAIDVYPLHPPTPPGPGIGRLGRLQQPEPLDAFAQRAGQTLSASTVQRVGEPDRPIQRVAIACGAGDEFVADAARCGADVLLTGEARFHQALEAESKSLALVLPGHYATERPGIEDLAERLAEAFPQLKVWASRAERDPLQPAGGFVGNISDGPSGHGPAPSKQQPPGGSRGKK